ncbi:putative 1-phosphatidylinositol 3-phosphate 5-kinase [Condylostylus longicornis]|uniref:putative 1-phosphatidylinositol 3-phosphate 5-kinase n=1 Tax=Condylostylus longicornis TaxID=2530218 RepID=UPI00244E286F|nr:putative 1-phosphatidylinositol 3-phosphate 5-kinase [Condylostylus longicornis]
MNRHLHSPTKLTEFARNFEEQPETLLTKFVNKITNAYNTSYNTVNDVPFSRDSMAQSSSIISPQQNLSQTSLCNVDESRNEMSKTSEVSTSSSEKSISIISNDESPELVEKPPALPVDNQEGRTMLNVLKRISNIVASKNNNLRNYKETDLQRLWMPDEKAKECYDCGQKFSTFRRKHHCRLCGQIFCSKCCNQVVPGRIIMCSGDLKVCTYCSKIVLSYLKSSDIALDLKHDLQALQQDLSNKFHHHQETNETIEPRNLAIQRKISVGYQEERFVTTQPTMTLSNADRKNILQQSHSLKSLYEEMKRLLPLQNCGLDLIAFLITNQKSSNKVQAIAILNAMLEGGFLIPLVPDSEQRDFDENLHYKLIRKVDSITRSGSIQLDVDYETNSVHMSKSLPLDNPTFSEFVDDSNDFKFFKSSFDESLSFQSLKDVELENSIKSKTTAKLVKSYCDHEELLLSQMLRNYNLNEQWSKILIQLCARVANHFRPEYLTNDLMDIRNYINFKKIAGGTRQDSTLINGVVFSKNVAHKEMLTRIEKPKVLLLQCPIAFERVEGKFVSFEKLLLQEREYLRNVTQRILSFEPDVVLVHKDVAGIAQDMLRSAGVTLVLDVKLSVMERLAKCLQCDIVTSIESKFRPAKLGVCDVFYTKNFSDGKGSYKTLMFFEMLSNARCCYCLLRGGSVSELAKVKKVSSLLVYARYNWRLEMSFLLDEFARPPSPKLLIFDSKEHSPSTDVKNEDEINGNEKQSPDSFSGEILSLKEDESDLVEEPQHKRLVEKKSEEKLVTIENVCDFSDPLRAPEITSPKTDPDVSVVEFAVETPYDNRFRTALSSTVLSISPFVAFPLPYLETEQGRKCLLRSLFPNELFFSKQWSNNNIERNSVSNELTDFEKNKNLNNVMLNPVHPFLEMQITKPFDDREIQTLLAEFRAFGGRYPKTNKKFQVLKREESIQKPQKVPEDFIYKDALDLQNHQRLPVLFCSFYYNPQTASSLCAQPYLLDMKFYGQQDIMLGQFLQRYCFKSYICQFCNLPMMDHVRRYVHSMGCVQVQLTEDPNQNESDKIFLMSACSKCNVYTPSVAISEDTKCFSFAKYLELHFYGHSYKIREIQDSSNEKSEQISKCPHSMHKDYVHYFSNKGIMAKFTYTPIDVWEIGLPPLIIVLKQPKPFDNMVVLEDVKKFSVQGHEIYSKIHEKIAELSTEDDCPMLNGLKGVLNRDQLIFKQHIEIVQTLLTEKQVNSYDINDAMLKSKRALAESIELWGPRLSDASSQIKVLTNKQENSHVDSGQICTEDLKTDLDSPTSDSSKLPSLADCSITDNQATNIDTTTNNSDVEQNSPPLIKSKDSFKVKNTSDSSSDKKTIKKMLSQLLPNTGQVNVLPSPMSLNEHLTLPLGAFPILVHDQDLSSIIAYCLVSNDYKKSLESLNSPNVTQNEANSTNGSPNMKRKSHDNSVEPEDKDGGVKFESTEEKKTVKSNFHIELYYQDLTTQFTCKIYFAKEFDKLRSVVLQPPKLNKSAYKDIEISKKMDDSRITQKSNVAENELLRKTSSSNLNNKTTESSREFAINQNDITDETRLFLARSLCRSVQWEARGGKSGSKFSKTLDDRFVLKEMSQREVAIFENLASNYFDYISKCLKENNPTLLAKILGVYRVTVKKKDFLQEKCLLVMENLFYDCDIKNKFDLKGSERNRLVDPTNQNGGEIVLLDENLIQMSWSKPLYILSHSKTILKEAINRDSSFLEKNDVMDYSLLVGLDNGNKVLVLGIIDYIRTFTFDKKVESFVKQSLAGQGKLPTVIRPERYKQRFIEAMDRYFLSVPDRWEGLSKK